MFKGLSQQVEKSNWKLF